MKQKTTKVRLKDIARKTGYSVSTVAKVLTGSAKKARISDATAQEVLTVAKQLGYAPNLMARNLRSKKSGLIGIYLASANDSIIAATLTAILQELPARGYVPLLTVEDTGYATCHETWIHNRVEGLLFCGPIQNIPPACFAELEKNNIPIVTAGNPYKSQDARMNALKLAVVQIDNRLGIQLLIDHMLEKGRKRIAFITGPPWHSDADERKAAYEALICKRHPPVIAEIAGRELFWQRGFLGAKQLIQRNARIDAIIAYDDNVALGAMKYLSDNHINIPEDIAIAGFDNQPFSKYSIPSLTTIHQPADEIGRKSVELLEKLICRRTISDNHIYIKPSLVVRASTT